MTDAQPLTRREIREAERAAELLVNPELAAARAEAVEQDDAEFAVPEALPADLLARLQPEASDKPVVSPAVRAPAPLSLDEALPAPVPAFNQPVYEQAAPALLPALELPTGDPEEVGAVPLTAPASLSFEALSIPEAHAQPAPLVFVAPAPLSFAAVAAPAVSVATASAPVTPEFPVPTFPLPGETAAELFNYPAAAPAQVQAEPIFIRDPEPELESPVVGRFGRVKAAKPAIGDSKGVNLLAAIGIVCAVVAAGLSFVPDVQVVVFPIAAAAAVLSGLSFLPRGFGRLQSIIAIVLALAAGGYTGYTTFSPAPVVAVPAAVAVPASPEVHFEASSDGVTLKSVTFAGVSSGAVFNTTLENQVGKFLKSVKLKAADKVDPTAFAMSVTAGTGSVFVSCQITLDGVIIAAASAQNPTSPLACSGAAPAATPKK
jgi:hypothetical protein